MLIYPPLGELFNFPSRYSSSIGLVEYLELAVSACQLPTRYPTRSTLDTQKSSQKTYIYGTITLYCVAFQPTSILFSRSKWVNPTFLLCHHKRFGLFSTAFGRSYSRYHLLFSLPLGTKMLQFPRFPSKAFVLDNSSILGSKIACISPKLIAACHALFRSTSQVIH